MRAIATRYMQPAPFKAKKVVSVTQHLEAPVKGLSMIGAKSTGDPQTATILSNWVIHEDRIRQRPGTAKLAQHSGHVHHLMPYLAEPEHLLACVEDKVVRALDPAQVVRAGFTNGNWHWTMYADLSQKKHLVMVNGADGVWSYDGTTTADPGIVTATALSNANPAVVTVAAGDIGKFTSGRTVVIAGCDTAHSAANGPHVIGVIAGNTFTLVGVNLSAAVGTQPAGFTADVYGAMQKEVVLPPADAPYCDPNNFQIVLAHLNRLYFADSAHLAFYYLPLQQKGGTLVQFPLNAVFKRGGTIRALASWTVDGGAGMDDKLCVFTSNGECAIFTGIDPADDGWGLLGVFKFDAPMSRYCCQNYGGDLWVLASTGLIPMTTMMRSEQEKLSKTEKGTVTYFRSVSRRWKAKDGWYLTLDNTTGRMLCNMPLGAKDRYQQMVRFMPDPVWAQWNNIKAHCWAWMNDRLYCGSEAGGVYQIDDELRTDEGGPISCEVRMAWNAFKTPGNKHFKMLRVYGFSDGTPTLRSNIAVDYKPRKPVSTPTVTEPIGRLTLWSVPGSRASDPGFTPWSTPGSRFGQAGFTPWSGTRKRPQLQWNGAASMGKVGAAHVLVSLLGAEYEITGFDVVYEVGSIV